MRRAPWLLLLPIGLGCAGGLLPAPALVNVRAGPCGTIEGHVHREHPWQPRAVVVMVDGQPGATVALDAELVPFVVPAAPGPHALTVDDGELSSAVLVPPPDVRLAPRPPPPLREGDAATVRLGIAGACPRDGLQLSATLSDLQRVVADRQPLPAAGEVALDVGALPQGRHLLTVRLDGASGPVDQRTLELTVAAPCDPTSCADLDGDGYLRAASGGSDCDDTDPAVFPGASVFPDRDGDGAPRVGALDVDCDGVVEYADAPTDCDDDDPMRPRPEEPTPNGIDDDCDGVIDEGTVAYDDDGDGQIELHGDCNDADPTVFRGAPELPDCKDNSCDGTVDEGAPRPAAEDGYEPNDDTPFELLGAQPRRGLFGGYRPTDTAVNVVFRDPRDAERFVLQAHDGAGDLFYVEVRLASAGDGLRYRARIDGPAGVVERELRAGETARLEGGGFADDSGAYTLVVAPIGAHPAACPAVLQISSG